MDLKKLFPSGEMNEYETHYLVTGATGYFHAVAVKVSGVWELTDLGKDMLPTVAPPVAPKVEVKPEPKLEPKHAAKKAAVEKMQMPPKVPALDDLDF